MNYFDAERNPKSELDLGVRTFPKDSFLARVLDSWATEETVSANKIRYVKWGIEIFAACDSCWATLQKRPELITPQQLHDLFGHLEEVIQTKNIKGKKERSQRIRGAFTKGSTKLSSGDTTWDVNHRFRTRFPDVGKTPSSLLGKEVSAESFTTLSELNDKIKERYEGRLKGILAACEQDIDQHISNVAKANKLKKILLDDRYESSFAHRDRPPYKHYQKGTVESLHRNARLICVRELHQPDEFAKYIENWRFYSGGRCKEYLFYKFWKKEVKPDVCGLGMYATGEKIFDIFLPSRILLACQIVLMIATASNASPIRTLSRERIQETPKWFFLTSLKGKTDKINHPKIDKRSNPVAVKAINLLLEHDRNIDKYGWERESSSMFCVFNGANGVDGSLRNTNQFGIFQYACPFGRFKEWHELEPFSMEDLRDLCAQKDYVINKDPFRVQALLGHRHLGVTDGYLKDTVIGLLNEANVAEYMRRLAPSIVYSILPELVEEHDFDSEKVDPNLLFPVSKYDGVTEAHSDRWLMNQEGYRFTVDADSIVHCAYQLNYYKAHLDALLVANEKKFVTYHLPRILFCRALYNLVEASEHGELLKKAEESLDEDS
ncbi:MAG: hypothetical protein LC540_15475 [Candidatus Thiodiazotropha sp.]|nr:hypothetical protein [Candidatus Thiodiazotropha sp.]